MQLTKYDIFLKIIEHGSLTRTAEALGYTQSAVSQIVRALESELGVTLLLRGRMGLSLTSEGKQLLPYIQEICKAQSKLYCKLDAIKGISTGEIRIGAYHLAAAHILPGIIQQFLQLHPHITFQIKEGDFTEIRSWINNGTVDLGFLAIQDIHDLECIPYQEDTMYAVFPSDAPECKAASFNLQNISEYSFIYLDEGDSNDCTNIFHNEAVTPNIVYTVREDATVLSMVENHLGISILPGLAKEKQHYKTVFIPTAPSYNRILGIAVKNTSAAPFAVRKFINFVSEHSKSA